MTTSTSAHGHLEAALIALDMGDLDSARSHVAQARRALGLWGRAWPQTTAQAEADLTRPLECSEPRRLAADWLQVADDELQGDTISGEEPYPVREYLAQDVMPEGPAPREVDDWFCGHRIAYPAAARTMIATALAVLEGR